MSNELQKQGETAIQTTSIASLSEEYLKSFKSLTVKADTSVAEALRLGTSNFGMLNAGRGNTVASQSIITVVLLNLLDFFTAQWNDTQLEDCAEIIATDYYWLSQAEFKIFTLRCKKGRYGTDYGKLSPQRLLLWLDEFGQECQFERAGVLSLAKAARTVIGNDNESFGFESKHLFEKFRIQLAESTKEFEEQETRRIDENILKYQARLRERWQILNTNNPDGPRRGLAL